MRANPPTRIFTYIYSKRPPRRGGRFGYSFNLLFRATGGSRPHFHEEWWFPHLHVCIISSGTLFNKSYHKDSHLIFQMKENEKKYFLYFFKNKAMKTQVELAIIKKVREYRLAAGMSQAQLSMEMNLDITFVGNVESAKCKDKYNFNHLNALAIIFNCKMKDFMPDENFPDDNSKYLKRDK